MPAAYEFLKNPRYNWRKFLLGLVTVVVRFMDVLTSEQREKVLIIDDFLANGEALRGLIEIVHEAEAELIGIGVAIEKGFQPGGQRIREAGIHLESLAIIESADETGIRFREE